MGGRVGGGGEGGPLVPLLIKNRGGVNCLKASGVPSNWLKTATQNTTARERTRESCQWFSLETLWFYRSLSVNWFSY